MWTKLQRMTKQLVENFAPNYHRNRLYKSLALSQERIVRYTDAYTIRQNTQFTTLAWAKSDRCGPQQHIFSRGNRHVTVISNASLATGVTDRRMFDWGTQYDMMTYPYLHIRSCLRNFLDSSICRTGKWRTGKAKLNSESNTTSKSFMKSTLSNSVDER